MPTGYTAGVQDGSITDFASFAMLCARAFGATIDMRDDPLDKPIPEFKPSMYHAEQLPDYHKRYYELIHMSLDECEAAAQKEYDDAVSRWAEREDRRWRERTRYQAMIDCASAWVPPTPDHNRFKDFMLEQLNESLEFDCGGEHDKQPVKKSATDWLLNAIKSCEWHIAYHEEHHAAEIERVAKRNAWVRALRESLQ